MFYPDKKVTMKKKVISYRLYRHKWRLILTVKNVKCISNVTISVGLHVVLVPIELPCSQNTLSWPNITILYNLFISENISKYQKSTAKTASKTQQLTLCTTELKDTYKFSFVHKEHNNLCFQGKMLREKVEKEW